MKEIPPRRTRVYPESAKTTFLVYILILSIAVFFAGTFLAYLSRFVFTVQNNPAPKLPAIVWLSTAILLAGSFCLRRAVAQVRRERQRRFKRWLIAALSLGSLFCLLQSFAMREVLHRHWQQAVHESGVQAAIFLLVLLHVLHFLVGLLALAYVTYQAHHGRYDHEYYAGVKMAAVYWRFLDIIWLIMLLMFWFSGHPSA